MKGAWGAFQARSEVAQSGGENGRVCGWAGIAGCRCCELHGSTQPARACVKPPLEGLVAGGAEPGPAWGGGHGGGGTAELRAASRWLPFVPETGSSHFTLTASPRGGTVTPPPPPAQGSWQAADESQGGK